MVAAALFSSDNEHWNTPRNVLDALIPLGGIALDPCSNVTSMVPSWSSFALYRNEDGLAQSWLAMCPRSKEVTGYVYVNPPYPVSKEWSRKIVSEASQGCEIVALVPARTDTQWWSTMAANVDAIAFWRGRLKFGAATNSAPFPSALLYWGPRVELFCSALRPHANLMVPTRESQLASQER